MVVSCNEVEFPDICSTLVDKKINLGEKVTLLKQLKKDESDYDHIVIDWICSTIEFVSNTDKYITLNSADINHLLVLLNNKLKVKVLSPKKIILKPNIFDVLTRFFSLSSTIIDRDSLLNTWHILVQHDHWKENLTTKSNITSLAWFCEFYTSNRGDFDNDVILNIIERLLESYLYYMKSQYVSKKVFTLFCNELLIKLMCMQAACSDIGVKYGNISSNISNIFALVVCSKEQLASVKLVLKASVSTETPNKKRKLDDSSVQEEMDTSLDKKDGLPHDKTKDSKDNLHFQLLFNELSQANPVIYDYLLKALPTFYETLVSTSRSSQSSLTRVEEMYLLIRLKECLKFTFNEIGMTTLEQLLNVVIKYDIYQRSEDSTLGNTFHKWMADLVESIINHPQSDDGDAFDHLTLKIMLKILNISHVVLEPVLPNIWNMCLNNQKNQSVYLQGVKESLLCELLGTYEKLHQLDHLFSTFDITELKEGSTIVYPEKFLQRFQKSVSCLLTVQINGILNIYLAKLKAACTRLKSNQLGVTFDNIEQQTYMLCHLVLMNASVIPANGYRKSELDLFIEKLRMLKASVKEFVEMVQQNQGNGDKQRLSEVEEGENIQPSVDADESVNVEPCGAKVLSPPKSWTNIELTSCTMMPPGFMGQYPSCDPAKEYKMSALTVQALVQHGLNNVVAVLKEFSLLNDGDNDLVVFDELSSTYSEGDKISSVSKYLVVALCFDQLSTGTVTDDLITITKKIYTDACHHIDEHLEKWNGQIFCISGTNLSDTLVKLFEENLSVILSYNDEALISCGFDLVWKQMLHAAKRKIDEHSDASEFKLLQSLPCFNNAHLQTSLLSSIYSFAKYQLGNEMNGIELLLAGHVDRDKMIEIRNSFSFDDEGGGGKVEDSTIDEEAFLNVFKLIEELPLVYFTDQNLFTLSVIMLSIWEKFRTSSYVTISENCVQIVGNIMEVYAVGNRSICHLPLTYIFNTNISYALKNQMRADVEGNLISLCVCTIRTVVKYVSRGEDVIASICNMVLAHLNEEEIPNTVILITEKMLAVLSEMLSEPTIKSRSEHTAYQIISTLSASLLKMMSCLNDEKHSPDTLFSIFGNLCKITQHGQVAKSASSPLKSLEDDLIGVFPEVGKSINKLLDAGTESQENKHLQVIEFLYSSSHEFTLQLRKLLQQDEAEMILILLKNAEVGSAVEKYGHLVATIVLSVDHDTLVKLLDVLTEKLVSELKRPEKKWILKVWHMLLTSKWEKEQRITLWDYLPKVMLACVHMTKLMKTSDDIILLLKLLTSAVNIGKNSLMSQYVNIIYHAFVMLPKKVEESQYKSFVHQFEEIYQLASQLLFHHQSAIFSSLHAYISSVNSIFQMLSSYSSSSAFQAEESHKCCERMARLYREIGSHKGVISKYSPFIISRFIRTSLSSSLTSSDKKLLEGGIYCIMDTCTDTEFSFLNTTLEKADKEYFKILKNSYDKHHKFTGKA